MQQTWTLADDQGASKQLSLRLRQFFPPDLEPLLNAHRFKVVQTFGDFAGAGLDEASLKQILACQLQ